jgi:hypothetical protein
MSSRHEPPLACCSDSALSGTPGRMLRQHLQCCQRRANVCFEGVPMFVSGRASSSSSSSSSAVSPAAASARQALSMAECMHWWAGGLTARRSA